MKIVQKKKKYLFISDNFDKINLGKKLINLIENKANNTHFDINTSDKSLILDLNNVILVLLDEKAFLKINNYYK